MERLTAAVDKLPNMVSMPVGAKAEGKVRKAQAEKGKELLKVAHQRPPGSKTSNNSYEGGGLLTSLEAATVWLPASEHKAHWSEQLEHYCCVIQVS